MGKVKEEERVEGDGEDEGEGDGMERRGWEGEFVEKKGEGEKGN